MGSFYATCSISRYTIADGQSMYMQFMLPAGWIKDDPRIGELFVESFLKSVETNGLEKAKQDFKEATSTWGKGKELSSKGMLVSNDGAYTDWVPFGPAIRGKYDDYGRILPDTDEDSALRVTILEELVGLPFDTIMEVAQDDRWFTLGLGKYGEEPDNHWRPEGINKDMPEWQLLICQKLSMTYFHAAVYDELSKFDFSCEERDGIMKSEYDIKWKNEYLDPIKTKLPTILKEMVEDANEDTTDEDKELAIIKKMEKMWERRDVLRNVGVFRCLTNELSLVYQACMARSKQPLDWFYESLIFMYNISGMCLSLQQSEYGSQHLNFFGWQRIMSKLAPQMEETLKKYGYYDEEE